MQHFLNGNLEDSPSPPPYETQLLFGDALLDCPLHTESGEQVAAHYAMLKLCSLGQQVNELRPVFYSDWSVHQCSQLAQFFDSVLEVRRPELLVLEEPGDFVQCGQGLATFAVRFLLAVKTPQNLGRTRL